MFKKLRLRLVLMNVAIAGLIVVIIAAVAYVLISGSITRQSQQMLQMLSMNIGMQADSSEVNADMTAKIMGGLYPYFIIEVDNEEESILSDFKTGIGKDAMLAAAKNILAAEAQKKQLIDKFGKDNVKIKAAAILLAGGVAEIGGKEFRYADVSSKGGITYLIFLDMAEEKALLGKVVFALSVCAAVGLAMVFFGGLFLAGRSIAPIRAAWQKQRDFVADASHELRSPLAALRISLDAVLSAPKAAVEEKKDFLEGMGDELGRLSRLVDDMLLMARADSDAVVFADENVNIAQTAETAVNLMRPVAENKSLGCALEIEAAPLVRGDAERLRQAILILLDNAVKYTPEGGNIRCAVRYAQGKAIVEVSDTGIGIEKENLGLIFERFFRADKARSREAGGQGLGLSIAKWIVEKHRGKIEVASEPGKGSTFTIILPEAS